ncbi:N-acetylmuramic acid 6-phosphate etherase [Capronia epimyces CBS 606.96]|uniref:N-acetylmuramic acid 6-phosphate etherase n=1 Tax=Capronia epimyces CBS 606.96 TaxID=1182542 RepID=W9XBG3_9EURO|nr:N-acetylmuramic acid 6-phosphate etherase [Capronia epimyces CBS 606.96]EXJ77553.1 N-acetylmuramic acid 6-phosphate etherase [Capronia epimyces CBS 606.96]
MPSQQHGTLDHLLTEAVGQRAQSTDSLSTLELCEAFNWEEAQVAPAVACTLPAIASLIDDLVPRLRSHGRLIYVGAGNSGRVGFMDCSELPATFAADPKQFLAVVAGGPDAIIQAQEGAEDGEMDGVTRLEALQLTSKDTVIGISASGRTPFVVGALLQALKSDALTVGITNTHPSRISRLGVTHCISALVGPELVAGSTRLKAGSAAKQILNMISTCSMIRLGKTYQGLMIDVAIKNDKLRARGRRIVRHVAKGAPLYMVDENGSLSPNTIQLPDSLEGDAMLDRLIATCGNSVKLASAVAISGLDPDAAQRQLDLMDGHFHRFVESLSLPVQGQAARAETKAPVLPNGSVSQEYFLSIDGGGTNCTVCIATRSQIVARATAGACNFNCVSLEQLLEQVKLAQARALAQMPAEYHSGSLAKAGSMARCRFKFTKVWAAIAGLYHAYQLETLTRRLEDLFGVSLEDGSLWITSDSVLPSACIGLDDSVEGGVSVIAGTGSVATAFRKRSNGEVAQVGRTGGWGHLIGDQGSAFDIGKRALQTVLVRLEQSQGGDGHGHELTELEARILARLDCGGKGELLSSILHSSKPAKLQIGDVARVVTDLGLREKDPDPDALAILTSAARSLVQLILPLTKPPICDPGESSLVLSGALLNLPGYRKLILDELAFTQPIPFKKVVVFDDVSGCAAQFLARRTGTE